MFVRDEDDVQVMVGVSIPSVCAMTDMREMTVPLKMRLTLFPSVCVGMNSKRRYTSLSLRCLNSFSMTTHLVVSLHFTGSTIMWKLQTKTAEPRAYQSSDGVNSPLKLSLLFHWDVVFTNYSGRGLSIDVSQKSVYGDVDVYIQRDSHPTMKNYLISVSLLCIELVLIFILFFVIVS